MRRLFIIRHGNTFASSAQARRVGSRTDIPLVESGVAQADRLGQWFAGQTLPIDRLLASPLQRARQTADRIAIATGHAQDGTRDWLGEIDHGPDEGRPEAEVVARIGAQALADWDERGVAPDGWIVDADRRISAWRAFFAEREAGVDLLVTSNGAARFALIAAGLPLGALKLRTGAFGELAVDATGAVTLLRWDERP
ncbi:histidine phosphatase family protein [Sphingobium sp. CR2-8]|uniref:histidine phosphatase family protein n=1 Tax=Sphingobium sp. CR2-8 TaxID=1306534 RepID=UPI002DC0032C|nr:histidine phosphatase family protein [Sphingobium sp. CR2-8]MEC3912378.1 histidine phosphatase family protein [Sphingobium sp. CR2-8]